jgi:hypothetical protein
MRRILREPLFHFLLLGAALFAAYGVLSGRGAAEPDEIVVTRGRIESLATVFQRTWQRPPTQDELDGLVAEYVREEVCAREAVALGLDQDDSVIRRRLRQKLEFVSEDLAAEVEPTDGELQAYLDGHAEAFRVEPSFAFRQVFLSPEQRGEGLARDAAELLAALRSSAADPDAAGDPILLDPSFEDASAGEVARLFGQGFAEELARLPSGEWQGPVESAYGAHLVLLAERRDGGQPALDDVREEVRREWANDQRLQANEEHYRTLLQPYRVTVEGAGPAPDAGGREVARQGG